MKLNVVCREKLTDRYSIIMLFPVVHKKCKDNSELIPCKIYRFSSCFGTGTSIIIELQVFSFIVSSFIACAKASVQKNSTTLYYLPYSETCTPMSRLYNLSYSMASSRLDSI